VVIGSPVGSFEVIDRRRIELVKEKDLSWAKQPFHAAENLAADEARSLVHQAIKAAHRNAKRELDAAKRRAQRYGYKIRGCAVLMGEPMPDWSVEQILAVHFRMHKAEGVLFREALARAATECRLKLIRVPEKQLNGHAELTLATPAEKSTKMIAALGKSIGAPWGKDQKEAALAAMIALQI
jgi:hypothetical protein